MRSAILRALAARNGGPGLTAEELAEAVGQPVALVRSALAVLVYDDREVRVEGGDRMVLGEPPESWRRKKQTA